MSAVSPGNAIYYGFLEPQGISTKDFVDMTGLGEKVLDGILYYGEPITERIAEHLHRAFPNHGKGYWLELQRKWEEECE